MCCFAGCNFALTKKKIICKMKNTSHSLIALTYECFMHAITIQWRQPVLESHPGYRWAGCRNPGRHCCPAKWRLRSGALEGWRGSARVCHAALAPNLATNYPGLRQPHNLCWWVTIDALSGLVDGLNLKDNFIFFLIKQSKSGVFL